MSLIASRRLLERLRQGERFLSDGAMGTELIKAGVDKEDILGANLDIPDRVSAIHNSYIVAGSQIITTNTFGFRTGKDWGDAFQAGISLGMLAVQGSKSEVGVWVSIIPNIVAIEIDGLAYLSENSLHWPSAILLETCTSLQTTVEAMDAIKSLNLDMKAVTFHFRENGLMPDGTSPETAAKTVTDMGADIVGANCGENPRTFIQIAEKMRAVTNLPLLMQPNAGLPVKSREGFLQYDFSEQKFAETAKTLYDVGVNIIGGCCGTSSATISAINQRLFHQSPY